MEDGQTEKYSAGKRAVVCDSVSADDGSNMAEREPAELRLDGAAAEGRAEVSRG
jgi:hypothetical protein